MKESITENPSIKSNQSDRVAQGVGPKFKPVVLKKKKIESAHSV
jgi:hypothetical protein